MKRRIYIAGPIRGKRNLNREAFEGIEATLTALGFDVVNPHKLGFSEDDDIVTIMRQCLLTMMLCDGVFMLPGWQTSAGAKAEHEVAKCLKMKIIDGELSKVINVSAWFPPPSDDGDDGQPVEKTLRQMQKENVERDTPSHLRMVGGDRDDDG